MTNVIFGVLWIVTIIGAGIYARARHRIESDHAMREAVRELEDFAMIAVRWAQDRLGCEPGNDRRVAAINALKAVRDKLGVDITDEQVAMLVSAAYRAMVCDVEEE